MEEVENSFDCENTPQELDASLHRSKSESSLLLRSPPPPPQPINSTDETVVTVNQSKPIAKSNSDETLSTPFRYDRTEKKTSFSLCQQKRHKN